MKNVAILLSGGVGKRFGGSIPKQYVNLCGKPVINYVLKYIDKSIKIDELVIVMDEQYKELLELPSQKKVSFVKNGKERVNSIKNALEYIKLNIVDCENIIILQAVSPFISETLMDKYIELLNEYDVVTTAEKCVGEIFNKNQFIKFKRDDYYFCQSPEAFKFEDLYNNIDVNSDFTELIYHYKFNPNIYFYTNHEVNVKLTYKSDLDYAEYLMKKNAK